MQDHKKAAAIIIAGLKPQSSDSSDGEKMKWDMSDQGTGDTDLETAGKEVFDALKRNDVKDFTDALEAFIKICGYSSGE